MKSKSGEWYHICGVPGCNARINSNFAYDDQWLTIRYKPGIGSSIHSDAKSRTHIICDSCWRKYMPDLVNALEDETEENQSQSSFRMKIKKKKEVKTNGK